MAITPYILISKNLKSHTSFVFMCHSTYMEVRGQLWESVIFFYLYVGSGNGSQHHYWLDHLASPACVLLRNNPDLSEKKKERKMWTLKGKNHWRHKKRLWSLAALEVDLGSVTSGDSTFHNSNFRGPNDLIWPPKTPNIYVVCNVHAIKTLLHIK